MISSILPAHDADTISLELGIFIARQSYHYRVSRDAVVAAIRDALPSQPSSSSHAPAAQTDGEVVPPASPSALDQPETAPSGEAAQAAAAGESPAPQAGETPAQPMGGEDVAPLNSTQTETLDAAAQGSTLAGETAGSAVGSGAPMSEAHRYAFERVRAEFEADPTRTNKEIARAAKCNLARANSWLRQLRNERVEATKSGLVAAAPKPAQPTTEKPAGVGPDGKRVTIKSRVWAVHYEHPDWTAQQVADHLGAKKGSVATALFDARQARNAELAIAEPAPVPNPQKPVAPPPPAGFTLKYRVRVIRQQHPNLTAVLIAKQLGANPTSVSTYLAQIRNETGGTPAADAGPPLRVLPNGHAGEVETRIRSEAAARAARLGKPS